MTDRRSTLDALLFDLAQTRGPDREIDAKLMALFYTQDQRFIGIKDASTGEPVASDVWVDPRTGKWVSTHPREFTRALDEVLRLIEREFPEAGLLIGKGRKRPDEALWGLIIYKDHVVSDRNEIGAGEHEHRALCACLALVDALARRETKSASAYHG